MTRLKNLLLVDLENVHRIDLSVLDETWRAIIFVGAQQNPPKAARKAATAHRFSRVDFQKIDGSGKNALDFHIAFELGRTFETSPSTHCVVLSRDKGFDPLLTYLNRSGLPCRRIDSMDVLADELRVPSQPLEPVCPRCKKASTIEHHGGRWCSNCGRFSHPPVDSQLPSRQPGYRVPEPSSYRGGIMAECGWCHQRTDMTGGIYDDGEWMCGNCIAHYAR